MLIAQRFQIPFYDKELIFLAAQGNTLSAEVVEQYKEHLQINTIWSAGQNLLPFYQQPITDRSILDSVKSSGNWRKKALASL
ncbi:MAG TPA: hypothetical protein IAB84_04190 [Candidatus Choladousia intestinigallinarum]|nr:hypothetical protein [Candidatus Choladousia intestinigallinarum]